MQRIFHCFAAFETTTSCNVNFFPIFISGHHTSRNDLRAVLVLFLFVALDFAGPCFHLSSPLDKSARFVDYLLCIIFQVVTFASLERSFYSRMLGLTMWLGEVCSWHMFMAEDCCIASCCWHEIRLVENACVHRRVRRMTRAGC